MKVKDGYGKDKYTMKIPELINYKEEILTDWDLYELLKRPEITMEHIQHFIEIPYNKEVKEQVEINTKYEGYINKSLKEAEKMLSLEEKRIPESIDYNKIPNLASEARQKLSEISPTTIGQASRISGVNPADISLLMVYIKKEYFYEQR